MTIYGRSEELVSRCVECDLAEPESLASLGGSTPGLVDGILSVSQDCSCPCNIVVVFEMYSLIGSLVVLRDREAGALAETFTHASRFKYGRFRRQTGLRAVQKQSAHVSVAHNKTQWILTF